MVLRSWPQRGPYMAPAWPQRGPRLTRAPGAPGKIRLPIPLDRYGFSLHSFHSLHDFTSPTRPLSFLPMLSRRFRTRPCWAAPGATPLAPFHASR